MLTPSQNRSNISMAHLSDVTAAFNKLKLGTKKSDMPNYNTTNGDSNSGSSYSTHTSAETIPEVISGRSRYPKILQLDVGGRKFKVSRDVLCESGLLRNQLSDRYTWPQDPDGSYFLEADSDIFEHLLRFMRRPNLFPLFYTVASGFDFDLYNRLEAEAEYFQLDALHAWIKQKVRLPSTLSCRGWFSLRHCDRLRQQLTTCPAIPPSCESKVRLPCQLQPGTHES